MKKNNAMLEIKGFDIGVEWWENHINLGFPPRRVRPAGRGEKGNRVELALSDVCEVVSRHFRFGKDGDDRTCLEYFKNDGIAHKPGPKKRIDIQENGPRKAIIRICGHEIRATVSTDSRNVLTLTLPKNHIGDDFTLHDLCRALPDEFELNPRFKVTHIMCKKASES